MRLIAFGETIKNRSAHLNSCHSLLLWAGGRVHGDATNCLVGVGEGKKMSYNVGLLILLLCYLCIVVRICGQKCCLFLYFFLLHSICLCKPLSAFAVFISLLSFSCCSHIRRRSDNDPVSSRVTVTIAR